MEKTNEATAIKLEISENEMYGYRVIDVTNPNHREIFCDCHLNQEGAELIVKAVNAYDALVEENERLDKLAKWNLEQASMLAEDYKKTKDENQKLREAFGNCICSIEQYGSLGDSDLEKYKEVLTKAKNV